MMVRNYKLGTPTGIFNSGTGDKREFIHRGNLETRRMYLPIPTLDTSLILVYRFNTISKRVSLLCLVTTILYPKMEARCLLKFQVMHLIAIL